MTPHMSIRRRLLVPLLLCAAVVGLLRAAPAGAYAFRVSVTRRPVTRPLASNFLGLALEYRGIPQWIATPQQATDTVLPALIENLSPASHPSVRIGGESTDRSWWPVHGVATPPGITYAIGPSWAHAVAELVKQTGARLMLGINLETGSPLIARVEADELVRRLGAGNVQSLQIGNEPNLYRFAPWYRVLGGHRLPWYSHDGEPVYARPAGWDPADFISQFNQFARVLPGLPLAGPETNPGPWVNAFDTELSRHSRVRMITTHAYGLNQCVTDPASPQYPTVDHLLTEFASRGLLLNGIEPSLSLAHRDGATLRIDEMGSVTCTGRLGVSNTFASALWAADALFAAARIGVDGVNLHSYPNTDNGLFDFTYERTTHRWRATVHPIYDGALLFAQAAPAGSRILHIVTGDQTRMRAWATLAPDHKVRVLLINDSPSSSAVVPIHAPAGYGTATGTIERLTAPGAGATSNILLGGHRFSSTLTGVPRAPDLTSVHPHSGVDTVSMPAASAALVTIAPD